MAKGKQQPEEEHVVWVYDIQDIMCGLSFCIYNRLSMRLEAGTNGTLHFTTVGAATDHAVKLAKKLKYTDLVRALPWRE